MSCQCLGKDLNRETLFVFFCNFYFDILVFAILNTIFCTLFEYIWNIVIIK